MYDILCYGLLHNVNKEFTSLCESCDIKSAA